MFAFFVKVRASEQTCFNVSILVRLDLLRTRFITLITEELVRRDTAASDRTLAVVFQWTRLVQCFNGASLFWVSFNVTGGLDCLFIIWPFKAMKICQIGFNICKIQKRPKAFSQSGKFSPNLVTLVILANWVIFWTSDVPIICLKSLIIYLW